MKKYLLFAVGLLLCLGISAAHVRQELTINGEAVEKAVTRITFEGDNIVLHFSDNEQQTVDMDVAVVLSFLPDTETSIYSLKNAVGNRLDIKGLEPGTQVVLYDATGRIILTATAEKASTQLSTRSLKSGIYVIKAGNKIVKFLKR